MKVMQVATLLAALGIASSALAADPPKTKREPEKYGRAADQDAVRCGGPHDKPGRAAEECTVKGGAKAEKYGRAVAEEASK